ncbi:hypothetical protein [Streptomyces goshikiensis]|uniref:hypothetical protein n=1 Tax=Streptomyces goshikiensis TaxID=1942 RepID=UPI00369915AA
MHRDGCADAQKVGGRGDNGADALVPRGLARWGQRAVDAFRHEGEGGAALPYPRALTPAPQR